MEHKLEAIKEQIIDIKNDMTEVKSGISKIEITMGINTESLAYHIKRTDELQDMAQDFKEHMLVVNTAFKVIVGIGAVLLFLDQLGILDKLLSLIK